MMFHTEEKKKKKNNKLHWFYNVNSFASEENSKPYACVIS